MGQALNGYSEPPSADADDEVPRHPIRVPRASPDRGPAIRKSEQVRMDIHSRPASTPLASAASGVSRQLHGDRAPPQCQDMMNFTNLASVPSHPLVLFTDRLRLAVAAYLALHGHLQQPQRIRPALLPGLVRRAGPGPGLDPLAAHRPHPSCTSGGCRRSAGSSPPPCPAGSQFTPARI